MSSSSGRRAERRTGPGRARLVAAIAGLALLALGCGDDLDRIADQRIRGHVSSFGNLGSIGVLAESYDTDDPSVRVETATDASGNFELIVPDGTYRVSIATVYGRSYWGNGQARTLAAQGSPVTAGRNLPAPFLEFALGDAVIDLDFAALVEGRNLGDLVFDELHFDIDLVHPLLGTVLASDGIFYGDFFEDLSSARATFRGLAPDTYALRIEVDPIPGSPLDRAVVPVVVGGVAQTTFEVRSGRRTEGHVVIGAPMRLDVSFLGPCSARPEAELFVSLWEPEAESSFRSTQIALAETNEFTFDFLFDREILVQWMVVLPDDGNDPTTRWLNSWTRGRSQRILPSSGSLLLEATGVEVTFHRPDAPGNRIGWLELLDTEGVVRGAYFADDRDLYDGPIYFSNLPLGRYYLHYRTLPQTMLLDQWYGEGFIADPAEAAPIDALVAGTLVAIDWLPEAAGAISGVATFEDGSPAAQQRIVYTRGNDSLVESGLRVGADGSYQLTGLADGNYRVGIVRTAASQVTWYPGTRNLAEAEFITISDHESREGYDIRLLPAGGPAPSTQHRPPADVFLPESTGRVGEQPEFRPRG